MTYRSSLRGTLFLPLVAAAVVAVAACGGAKQPAPSMKADAPANEKEAAAIGTEPTSTATRW